MGNCVKSSAKTKKGNRRIIKKIGVPEGFYYTLRVN